MTLQLHPKTKIFAETIKDFLISGFGTIFASLVSLVFFILLSRHLGPAQFGIFSVLTSISLLIADISDFGVAAGLAYFVGLGTLSRDFNRLGRLLAGSLSLKFFTTLALVLPTLFLGRILLDLIFGKNQPNLASFQISLLGSMVMAFFSFAIFALNARRKYLKAAISNSIGNITRLLLFVVLVIFGIVTLELSLLVFFFGLFVGGILAFIFLPASVLKKPALKDLGLIFQFNKWLAVGTILFAVFTRIDVVLLAGLASSTEAGLYAAASRVTFVFPLIASTLAAVWSPRFSLFRERAEAVNYFKNSVVLLLPIVFATFLATLFSKQIISIFFGTQYLDSILPLNLLLIAWTVFLLGIPAVQFITYYLGRSDIYAFLTLIQFVAIVGLDVLFIPQFGAIGAAFAFLIGNTLVLLPSYGLLVLIERGKVNFAKAELLQKQ